jgi:hypothetical protein
MKADEIYVKTPKGIEEMSSRSHGLPQRARLVLIVMDGKRSVADIENMFPDGEGETLMGDLISGGFVTLLQQSSPVNAAPGKPQETFTPPKNDAERFEMAQNFMRNTVKAFLGGMGSGLVSQLDKCTNLDELRPHYKAWQEAIALSSDGRKQAPDLENRLAALLS